MNVLVDVRDVDGISHTRAFCHEEAERAQAWYCDRVRAGVEGVERSEALCAIDGLDLIVNAQDAYFACYAPRGYSPAWESSP